MYKLSEEDVHRYHEDGVIVLRSVVNNELIEKLRDVVETILTEKAATSFEHEKSAGRFFEDQFMWRRNETARDFIFNSPMAQIAAALTNLKQVNLFYDHVLVKEPGTSAATPWHNDMSYYHLNGDKQISIWLALDPVSRETGVKYWKGSHKRRLQHSIKSFAGDETYLEGRGEPLPDVDELVANGEAELLDWDLQPGDVLIHHGYVVHGAPGNRSSTLRRRGYVTRWIGDDITLDTRPGTILGGWEKLGFKSGLKHGDKMTCTLHPLLPVL